MISPSRILLTILVTNAVLWGLGAGAAEQATRVAVPSGAVQAQVTERLEEIFDFAAAKTPEARLALAKELQVLSKDAADNPAEQFVLLRKVMELASAAGDAEFMVAAVGAIGERFNIDAAEVQARMLVSFARDATTTKQIESLLAAAAVAIDEAMAARRYDVAFRIADAQYAACQRPAGRKFRKEVGDMRDRIAKLKAGYEAFRKALAAIEANPSDPPANLVVGRWYCFVENDWEQGPPHLAQGTDAELAALAKQELTKPAEAAAQAKLGDGWWDLSQKREGEDRSAMMWRAGYWYRKAQPGVVGLAKLKIEKRLPQIAKIDRPADGETPGAKPGKPKQPQVIPPKQAAAMFGLRPTKWRIEGDALLGKVDSIDGDPTILSRPIAVKSMQFGFRIKAKWYHCIRVQIDGHTYMFSRGHWGNGGTFFLVDGAPLRFRDGPKVTSPEEWHAIGATLKEDVLTFYYNGQQQWQGNIPAAPGGKHSVQVGFDSHSTTVGVKDVVLETE